MRIAILHSAAVLLVLVSGIGVARAQTSAQAEDPAKFPSRAVRLIVPSSPGGPVDAVARILADGLRAVWTEPLIVESKPGAGNSTGAIFVANASPDGYTLLVITDSITVNPSLYPNLDKDPLKQFAPVSVLVTAPQVLVARHDLPASDLRSFIADAKARPGALNVASSGPGTISHLTEVLLEQRAGIKTSHIPFRGAAPAVTALLGKHVDAAWLMPAPLLSSIASGQLKALAVTGAARDAKLPSVPTAEEAGLADFQIMNWQGLFAPAGTPKPLVDKIAQVVAEVVRKPEIRGRLAKVGFDARGDGPAAAAEQVRTNVDRWSDVIVRAGIKPADVQ
jgi:tripartite-type tricarboxylate transporter receptor subunit TctC